MSGSNIGYKIHVYFEGLHIRPPTQTQLEAADDGRRRRLTSFQPADNAELQTAMDAWCSDEAGATATYGTVESWDTSLITDMSQLLYDVPSGRAQCNPPIGDWDVSQVTTFS